MLRKTAIVLAMLVLAAHFLRAGDTAIAAIVALSPLLLLTGKSWSFLTLELLAYAGVLIWLHTAVTLVQMRMSVGAPWGRLLVILSIVAVFTLYSGMLMRAPRREKQ